MIIGDYFENIKCESFLDHRTGRIRVRPIPGQDVPTNVLIECSRHVREKHPVGTIFYAENVKVCKKPDCRIYLRAKDQMIYKL